MKFSYPAIVVNGGGPFMGLVFLMSLGCVVSACGGGADAPTCASMPVALTSDVLDPNEVYLVGTRDEGACSKEVLAQWSSPNTAVGNLDCQWDMHQVRPTDGRLLYLGPGGQLREFQCDDCADSNTGPSSQPLDNDTVLPTPPCEMYQQAGAPLTWKFLVSPSGRVLHSCLLPGVVTWHDANGAVVFQGSLLHLGYGDLALTESHVVNLASGKSTPITSLPDGPVLAVRARPPDRFMLVFKGAQQSGDGGGEELWEVDAAGDATLLGVYPPPPPGAQVIDLSPKLEACGALVSQAHGPMPFQDLLVRREIGGASAIVYDEATNPMVKMHSATLATGP